jgi:hypothetical protein
MKPPNHPFNSDAPLTNNSLPPNMLPRGQHWGFYEDLCYLDIQSSL